MKPAGIVPMPKRPALASGGIRGKKSVSVNSV